MLQWQVPYLLSDLPAVPGLSRCLLSLLPVGGFCCFQFESQGLILPGPEVGSGQVSLWALQAGLCLHSVSGMTFPGQQLLLCLGLVSEPTALWIWDSKLHRKPLSGYLNLSG